MQSRLQGNKMAAARKGKKQPKVRDRKWTDIELKQFAFVVADDKSEFAFTLETGSDEICQYKNIWTS